MGAMAAHPGATGIPRHRFAHDAMIHSARGLQSSSVCVSVCLCLSVSAVRRTARVDRFQDAALAGQLRDQRRVVEHRSHFARYWPRSRVLFV